jgi:hypothetical protein
MRERASASFIRREKQGVPRFLGNARGNASHLCGVRSGPGGIRPGSAPYGAYPPAMYCFNCWASWR